jgi:hypothetical protein
MLFDPVATIQPEDGSVLLPSGVAYLCLTCQRHHVSRRCKHCCEHTKRSQYTGLIRYLSGEVALRFRRSRRAIERWLDAEARTGAVLLAAVTRTGSYCTKCENGCQTPKRFD